MENFIQYLNQKEKEALTLLKSQKILEDDRMEPAIRVALRAIKDFAIPLRIKSEEDAKLFWKYFLVQDSEIKDLAQSLISKKEKKSKDIEKDKQKTLVNSPQLTDPIEGFLSWRKPYISICSVGAKTE